MTHELTPRRRAAYKRLKELGFYSSISKGQPKDVLSRAGKIGGATSKGRPRIDSRPVMQLTMSGEPVAVYTSVVQASKQVKVSDGNIYRVLNGKRRNAGGYRWVFADEYEEDNV